ncbi:MAG: hypothetical protein WCG04_01735 [Alphaproteobacteria bacterium]
MASKINNYKYTKVTLRQEYIILTGGYKKAILLEYFILTQAISDGWFNLSYETISKNSLLGLSHVNTRHHLKHLITNGWILRKKDEESLTYQYMVNLEKINQDLERLEPPPHPL